MKYKLVVDSCCEIVPSLSEKIDVASVPLMMNLGEDVYVDDKTLNVKEFVRKMKQYKGCPKSSCPSPASYADHFQSEGTAFGITLSSRLSGSYTSAMIGKSLAEDDGNDVYVFDSKSASSGEILVGLKIVECIEKGMEKLQIIEKVEDFIKKMKTFFVLENLDNLMKNGRMNKITGRLATVMHIRPILGSDGDGNIAFYSKAKGTKQALEKLGDMIGEHCANTAEHTLVITHCNNPEGALHLQELAEKRYSFKDIIVAPTGGLSSMYANEGGIIIAF